MHQSRFGPSIILTSAIAIGVALLVWRWSIDGPQMTSRELRDAVQGSLQIALAGSAWSAWLLKPRGGREFSFATALSLLFSISLGGIIMFNGHLASKRLACRDRVVAEMPTASATAIASRCFAAAASE